MQVKIKEAMCKHINYTCDTAYIQVKSIGVISSPETHVRSHENFRQEPYSE